MSKQNRILAAILIAQLVLIAVVFWPHKAVTGNAGKLLFPGVEIDRIAKLTITDAQQQSIQLLRNPDGWVLPEQDDYPCQDSKVTTFLGKLVALKTDRLVAQTETSHKQLGVAAEAYERLVEFELSDGTQHKLYLGTSTGASASHMRADAQKEVYQATDLSVWDVSSMASGWVDTAYWNIPQDQIVALSMRNSNGLMEFEKDASGAWTLKGLGLNDKLDSNSVQSFISSAASISLQEPLGKTEKTEYGLQQPSAVLTIQTKTNQDSKTYTLRVGAKDDKNSSYVVQSSESPYYVRVSQYTVQNLVEKARSGFLQASPTLQSTPGN